MAQGQEGHPGQAGLVTPHGFCLVLKLWADWQATPLEVAGVQGLVEVEEDLLVDHLLELETLGGRPELYAQDVIEDLDCWGVNHNQ